MPEEIDLNNIETDKPSLTAEVKPNQTVMAVFSHGKKSIKRAGRIDVFKMIKYIYPLTIFVIVLILIWVMSFLYNNVYLTMTQAEIVSNLKSKVIEESVNYAGFNAIVDKIGGKKKLAEWPYLNYLASPFAYGKKTPYPSNPAPASSTSPITITTTTQSTSTKN